MSAIAGFYNTHQNYLESKTFCTRLSEHILEVLKRRGPDDSGIALSSFCVLCSTCLSASSSPEHQPVERPVGDSRCFLIYDGEIYNKKELAEFLSLDVFSVSEGELLITGFLEKGPDFIKQVNGVFAAAFYDERSSSLYLFRDRSGIKPLFYTRLEDTFIFASEIKALLAYPGMKATLDWKGLNEVFSIGPARTYGCGVFSGIKEVLPGHYLICSPDRTSETSYWSLNSHSHEDSYEATVAHVAELLQDAVLRQAEADVPLCSLLSGGVDSSLISAICATQLKKEGKQLTTFSFDFKDSKKYFKSNSFQPSLDAPYVDKMVEFLKSEHHVLECSTKDQADALYDSVKAHDLPNMADVDSSLLYFCSKICRTHKIALTGECADEIFGGYPWFHKEECLNADTFPWTMDLNARKVLLSDEFLESLHMETYVNEIYHQSVAETPLIGNENDLEKRRKQISYLNLRWFMQTLLNRMDRDAAYTGLIARVPFADYRIIEYLWNVPWEMKAHNGVVKGLLRDSGSGIVPDEILYRKKSPYPKTYDTNYESLLVKRVRHILEDSKAPILQFLDKKKVDVFLSSPSDYGKPWYGQLMAAPQMLAYLIQINFWLSEYKIEIL